MAINLSCSFNTENDVISFLKALQTVFGTEVNLNVEVAEPVNNQPQTTPNVRLPGDYSRAKPTTNCCMYGSKPDLVASELEKGVLTDDGYILDKDGCKHTPPERIKEQAQQLAASLDAIHGKVRNADDPLTAAQDDGMSTEAKATRNGVGIHRSGRGRYKRTAKRDLVRPEPGYPKYISKGRGKSGARTSITILEIKRAIDVTKFPNDYHLIVEILRSLDCTVLALATALGLSNSILHVNLKTGAISNIVQVAIETCLRK